jgi:uncharacterized sulfatase
MNKIKETLVDYFSFTLPVLVVFVFLRIFEYFTAGIKLSVDHNLFIIFAKAIYFDIFTWLLYNALFFIPFLVIRLVHKKSSGIFLHSVNILLIIGFFGLLSIFSERLVPFDHELFVRHISESIATIVQVVTGRFWTVLPIFAYIVLYYALHQMFFRKIKLSATVISATLLLTITASLFMRFASPKAENYQQLQERYWVSNKLQYFISDSYKYLFKHKKLDSRNTSKENIASEIDFYQKNHSAHYVDKEYPLLHFDESKNVLKDFFRQSDTVPNIVIIIYEGLSRDFSGSDAVAGSFTPFLDSLAEHSLAWYNCLSNGQGTFGSVPSILGSLPFGDRGFTLQTVPPEHISLIKILKRNNWQTYYFTGAELNFDNFGSFLRLQGTDYILTKFGHGYHRMGVDKDGMSAGFPDDALFKRSLEVLDSIPKTPYLSVYLTVTTHSPYIFDQSKQYEKLFEKVMEDRKLPRSERKRLRIYKPLWASFLFTDDCMRHFFASYQKRKEFKNTIFIITGDHHHGFYPTRNEIDDYNVPLIIYSPMLKKPVNFKSVNCHLNITPTLLAYLKGSYRLKYYPRYVSWLDDELDTCRTFRNIHRIPFMLTNRDINDYLADNYYIGDRLYKLKPGLNLRVSKNKKEADHMVKIRENFKFINAYVCQNNKLYPASENIYDTKPEELQAFTIPQERDIPQHEVLHFLVKDFTPPNDIQKVIVQVSFHLKFDTTQLELLPHLLTYIYSGNDKKELLCSTKSIYEFVHIPKNTNEWSSYTDEDLFDMDNYPDGSGHLIKVAFYNHDEIKMKIKDLSIKFLGIK